MVVLVNPSGDGRSFEAKTDVPISPFNDRKAHEKEYFIPLMSGGEGKLCLQFQVVHNYVQKGLT